MAEFESLPFDTRPDLSPYIIHLTKNTIAQDKYSAFDNLVNMLEKGEIWGSDRETGFIKGPDKATCFMDTPIGSLKYILNTENSDPKKPRYEPYGLLINKKRAYNKGCRPVLYLSDSETRELRIPATELWRVVRLEVAGDKWISWMHEREWRSKGNFKIPKKSFSVFVKTAADAKRLQKEIAAKPKSFKSIPESILPLEIVCEGLSYLKTS